MKLSFSTLTLLACLPALSWGLGVAAQGISFFKDNKGDISVTANSGGGDYDGPSGKRFRFDLAGNVVVASRAQGLVMNAARMKGVVEPDPLRKGLQRLSDLDAGGGVTIIRTRTETVAGKPVSGRTEAKGNTATYNAGANDSGTATLNGNVVIVDDLGARKVNMLGNAGTATFSVAQRANSASGNSALKGATMTGNVRIKVTQLDEAGVASVYNASGDRLTYVNAGTSGTLTLSGNVKLDSPNAGNGGDVSNVDRAILTLNGNGEVTRVQFFADGPANKVRTVFKPKPSAPAKKGN